MIGSLTLGIRLHKIMKCKSKVAKRRQACPISKKFGGRSKAASNKVRINGKFASKKELESLSL